MEDQIIKRIKEGKIHSLSEDVEKYLSHVSHEDQKQKDAQKLKFQNFVEHLLQVCSTFLHEKQDDDDDVKEIFLCIQQCCQEKYCHFNKLLQVGRSFYHILINLLRLEYYNEAIYLSVHLKKIILKILQNNNNNNDMEIIIHNVYIYFWNCAIEVEKSEKINELKHNLSLKLRRTALEFLCFKYSQLSSVCEKGSKAIIWYITNLNNVISNKELTVFCISIWKSLITNRFFQHSVSYDEKKTVIFSILKMLKDWNKSLIKYIISQNLSFDILIWLDDIIELIKTIDDDDIQNIVKTGIDIIKCAINFFYDKINCEISQDISKPLLEYLDKICNKDCLPFILDPFISISCYYLLELFKLLEKGERDLNSKQFISLDFLIDSITNIFINIKGLIPIENCTLLLILIIRLQGGIIRVIREEIQKSLDVNYIKYLTQKGKRIMQQLSVILEIKPDDYLYEDEYIYIGTEIGNLGIIFFKKDMHNEAIAYLTSSCEYLAKQLHSDSTSSERKSLMKESLWKKYGLLARSYCTTNQFDKSFKTIMKGFLITECKENSAVDIWMKIKRELFKKNLHHIRKITMKQIIDELNIEIKMQSILTLLFAELKAYKSERHDNAEECHSVITSLLEISQNQLDYARSLVEMARWIWIYGDRYSFLVERSAVKCCREAIEIFKDQSNKEINNYNIKFFLSFAYFWLYQTQMKNLQIAAQKEIQNSSTLFLMKNKKISNIRGDEEDKEEICDINPAFSYTNIHFQQETLEPLNKALQLWIEIFNSNLDWKNILPMEELLELLDVVRTVAEIFNTAEKVIEEIKTWSLLKNIAKILKNPIIELQAINMLIIALSRYHLMDAAKHFIDEGKIILEEIVPLNSADSYAHLIKLKFHLVLSEYLFHSEEYSLGLQTLNKILSPSSLHHHHKSTKSYLLLIAEAKKLASIYLLLSPNVFSFTSEANDDLFNLIQNNTPINLVLESIKLCMGLMNIFSTDDHHASMINKDTSWYRPQLIRIFLESCLLLGKLYVMIGAPREARSILQESFTVAQSTVLANRAINILILLAKLDLLCENYDDCNTKIKGLKYILNFNKRIMNIENILEGKYSSNEESDSEDSDEMEFFTLKKSGNLKTEIRNLFLHIEDPLSSPPRQKEQNIIIPSFFNHSKSCSCQSCQYLPLHCQFLELIELQSSVNQYSLEKTEAILLDILKYQEVLLLKRMNTFTLILSVLFFKNKKIHLENKNKILRESDLSLICHVCSKLAVFKATQNKFQFALYYLNIAFTYLNKSSKMYKIIYANLHSKLTLQKIIISVQYILKKKNETRNFFNPYENVSSVVSYLVEKIDELNLDDDDSKQNFDQIKKYFTKTPRKISLKEKKIFRAPKKKKAPNPYLEKYIESLNKSDDDDVFINLKYDDTQNKKVQKQTCNIESKAKYSIERNCSLFKESDMSENCQNTLMKIDYTNDLHKMDSKRLVQERYSQTEMQRDDVENNMILLSDPKLKTYSTRHKQKISKIQNSEKCKSKKKLFKENIEDERNADRENDFSLSPNNNANDSIVSMISNSIFHEFENLLNSPELTEPYWSSPEIIRAKDDSPVSMKTRSRTRKKTIMNDIESRNLSHQNLVRNNGENYEALENVVRSSITEDNINNTFSEAHSDDGSEAKSKEFVEIEKIDVKLEDLALELKDAIALINHYPACPLYSNMCIMMSLLTKFMKNTSQDDQKFYAGYHVAESFAVTLKHQALISFTKKINKNEDVHISQNKVEEEEYQLICMKRDLLNFKNKINFQEKEKIQKIINNIPQDWIVVQVSTLPSELNINSNKVVSPVLFVSRLKSNSVPVTMMIESKEDYVFENNFLPEFNKILKESSATMEKKDAKIWWMIRHELDHQMKVMTENMENIWLGCWKGIFLGIPVDNTYKEKLKDAVSQILLKINNLNLTCIDSNLLEILLDSSSFLSDSQLLTAVCFLCKCDINHKGFKQLVKDIKKYTVELNFGRVKRAPVILILDKKIQILPWESLPLLRQHPVYRVPSLSLLHAQLASYDLSPNCIFRKGVNTLNTFYILNPSNDIPETQKKFQDIFKQEEGWSGIIGRAPTQQEFSSALTSYELLIYCGHGTGRVYLAGENIERLKCQAVAVLMGCSSGRLKVYGSCLEPSGVILQYWLGGSPCVVANLWDVTDKDIDRFTEAFLQSWLPIFRQTETGNEGTSIANAVSSARQVCRLPYLIGSAPVIYGLPVFTINVKR